MQHTEFQTALERLRALPDETKSNLGPKLNRYLTSWTICGAPSPLGLRVAPRNRLVTSLTGWRQSTVT